MQLLKKIFILSFLMLISFTIFNVNVFAEDKPLYVEDEVVEINNLAGGIVHKRMKARSMATRQDLLANGATEAGSGGSKPLILNQYYTQQVNMLDIPSDSETKIVPWGVVGDGNWTLAKVEIMAEDYERENPGWKVVAAINGDFFDISGGGNLPYTPTGTMMHNGDLYKLNVGWPVLGINNSGEGNRFVGMWKNETQVSSTPYLYIYDENDNIIKEFPIDKINTTPEANQTSVYFVMFDSAHKPISIDVNNGYIVEKAIDTVAYSKYSLFGKGQISKIGNATLKKNQFAIETNNEEIKNYLSKDVKIRVQYKITSEQLQNCDSIIGYHDKIMIDGVPCYENDNYGNARLPRTLLGTREDGSVVMLVVDGRQVGNGFYGICSEETGAIASYYGITNGFQMDGGGSATMVVRKEGDFVTVNSPSDSAGGGARSDGDGLLVVMRVPETEFTTISTESTIEISVNALELIEKYKDVYIEINGLKKQVVNGKVLFDNLTNDTAFVYYVYALVDGEYEPLVYQEKVYTSKITPTLSNFTISKVNDKGVERYEVTCELNDPDESVTYIVLQIGKNKFWLKDGKFTYPVEQGIFTDNDWLIEINYRLNQNNDKGIVEIKMVNLQYSNSEIIFENLLESINKSFSDLFIIN